MVCGLAKLAILLAAVGEKSSGREAFVSRQAAICRQLLSRRLIFTGACLPAKKAHARMTSHHKASARQPGGVRTGAAHSAVQKGGFCHQTLPWRANECSIQRL